LVQAKGGNALWLVR